MKNEAVRIAREETKRQYIELLKSPLVQALVIWILVEYLQRHHDFGSISGSILETSTLVKLAGPTLVEATNNLSAVAQAVAPLIAKTALAIGGV